jgi:farnesyl-diphosphate farnesyltransferase
VKSQMPASDAALARAMPASLRSPSIDWPLLKRVSRSFYLTLRLLPTEVRESIALAYLLARLSDTLVDGATNDAERQLLARRPEVEAWLSSSPDRLEIESVWSTIRQGQRFDHERFAINSSPLGPDELDRYTYLVAGCVGEFWTLLCDKKLPGFASLEFSELLDLGIRFGKGLQLVNVLRDRHSDAKMGRIYVPPERFAAILAEARAHLEAARRYVDALQIYRLRVACILPLYLGDATLDLVERYPSDERVKVHRSRVWLQLLRALLPGKIS